MSRVRSKAQLHQVSLTTRVAEHKCIRQHLEHLSLEMTGKALLFATIGQQKRENHRDFQRVSDDLTLTQAADILNRPIVVAENR